MVGVSKEEFPALVSKIRSGVDRDVIGDSISGMRQAKSFLLTSAEMQPGLRPSELRFPGQLGPRLMFPPSNRSSPARFWTWTSGPPEMSSTKRLHLQLGQTTLQRGLSASGGVTEARKLPGLRPPQRPSTDWCLPVESG